MPTVRIGKDRDGKMFYFVHVPRTGGMAICEWLGNPKGHRMFSIPHLRAVELRELHQLDDSWCFAVVRNPWDRAVSRFFWEMSFAKDLAGNHTDPCADADPVILFELWIEEKGERALRHKRFSAYSMLCDPESGIPIPRFILRHERLLDDLAPLMPDLEKYADGSLERRNGSKHRNGRSYRDFYRDEAIQIAVGEWMKQDCETFGYAYE